MKEIALFCLSNGTLHGTDLREGMREVSLNRWLADNIQGFGSTFNILRAHQVRIRGPLEGF